MQNSWVGLALPFCMIGFWFAAAVVDLFRMPNTSHNSTNQPGRDANTASVYKPVSR